MCVSERLHIHCRFWLAVNIWTNTPNVFGFSEGQSSSSDDENLPNLEESLVRAYTKLVGALYQQHVLDEGVRHLDPNRSLVAVRLMGVPKWPTEITSCNVVNSDSNLTENLKAICSRLNRMYYREVQEAMLQHLHATIMDWTESYSEIFQRLSSKRIWSIWKAWKVANKTVPTSTTPVPQHILDRAQSIIKMADQETVRRILKLGPDLLLPNRDAHKVVQSSSQHTQTDSDGSGYINQTKNITTQTHNVLLLDVSTQVSDVDLNGHKNDGTEDIPPIQMESQTSVGEQTLPPLNISFDSSSPSLFDEFEKNINKIIDNLDIVSSSQKSTKLQASQKSNRLNKVDVIPPSGGAEVETKDGGAPPSSDPPNITTIPETAPPELNELPSSSSDNTSTIAQKDPNSFQDLQLSGFMEMGDSSASGAEESASNKVESKTDKEVSHSPDDSTSTSYMIPVRGANDPLSNMYMSPLKFKGITYKSAEHCYQTEKARFFQLTSLADNIKNSNTAYGAKKMANNYFFSYFFQDCLQKSPDTKRNLQIWENTVRYGKMKEILHFKFDQSEVFKEALDHTGNIYLAHTVQDKNWGCGADTVESYNPTSKNIFGRLLMEIRSLKFSDRPIPDIPELPSNTWPGSRIMTSHLAPKQSLPTKRKGEDIAPVAKRRVLSNRPSIVHDRVDLSLHPPTTSDKSPYFGTKVNTSTPNKPQDQFNLVPFMVDIHDRTYKERKDEWQPPSAEFEVIILGDSNTKNMNMVDPIYSDRLAIHSYPGAHIKHMSALLRKGPTFHNTQHVILAVGINDRSANFQTTVKKHASALVSNAMYKFPNAQLYFPSIPQRLSPYQTEQFNLLYELFRARGVKILKNPDSIKFISDQIHYTDHSATKVLQHWLKNIKK